MVQAEMLGQGKRAVIDGQGPHALALLKEISRAWHTRDEGRRQLGEPEGAGLTHSSTHSNQSRPVPRLPKPLLPCTQ